MTHIETLKLALEAAEALAKEAGEAGNGYLVAGIVKIIVPIRRTIEQAEQAQPVAFEGWRFVPVRPTPEMCQAGYMAQDKWPNHMCDNRRELHLSFSEPRWTAMLNAAPAPPPRQSEQAQPVAWGYARKIKGGGWALCCKREYDEAVADGDDAAIVYTAPPQRQPLTDEQMNEIYRKAFNLIDSRLVGDQIKFARAIEAAHGIKGEA